MAGHRSDRVQFVRMRLSVPAEGAESEWYLPSLSARAAGIANRRNGLT
jgi:hypothetical protein